MKFSIVTPSFNQARFVEPALRSVLEQQGPEIEYIVMDGGSKDGSADIIRKFENRLSHWQSQPDDGQYDAITRGFTRATGEIFAWLNSDDLYTPWAFSVVAEIFAALPSVQWLTTTTQIRWDSHGRPARTLHVPGYHKTAFLNGEYLPGAGKFALGWIQQESTFWRRSLWEKAGAQVGKDYPLAGDFELWARFFQHAELHAVEIPLGGYRFHGDQKTGAGRSEYISEATRALTAHGGRPNGRISAFLRKHGCVRYRAPLIRHHRHTGEWRLVTVAV